jgi:hypothetical protein
VYTTIPMAGNTKGGSITVPLTSCLTGLESAVWQLTIFVCICKTDLSKPAKQEVNSTVILPPLVFPAYGHHILNQSSDECVKIKIRKFSQYNIVRLLFFLQTSGPFTNVKTILFREISIFLQKHLNGKWKGD